MSDQGSHTSKQHEEEEEEEDAPSLCDLPLTAADTVEDNYRHSLSDPTESFEFLTPDPSELSRNDIVWPSLSPASAKTWRSESLNEPNAAAKRSPLRLPSDGAIERYGGGNGRRGARRRSPPWYWLVLRPAAARNFERRNGGKIRESRSPARLFPAAEEASCERRAWRLISVLSCKSQGSVAVTTPFRANCSA